MKRLILILLASCGAVYAQQNALLLPWTPQQFTNTNGTVLANGKVCTYQAGTSTGLATYTDSTAATPNSIPPNAILLDSTGRPTSGGIWLSAAKAYKITVLTAGTDSTCNTGVTIKTQDNVAASNVGANNTFTGTNTFKTLNNKVYADQFAGANWGAQVAAAAAALGSGGGIIDATGFAPGSTQTSTANPWAAVTAPIILWMGPYTVQWDATSATQNWQLPNDFTLIGNHTTLFNTTLNGVFACTNGNQCGMVNNNVNFTTGSITNAQNTVTVANASLARIGTAIGIVGAAGGDTLGQNTTLNNGGNVLAGDTSFTVTSATGFAQGLNIFVLIDSEMIGVTSIAGNVFTVTRGQLGTAAAGHTNGATVKAVPLLLSQVTAVAGNVLTLADSASFTVTGALTEIGASNIQIDGDLTIDGNYHNRTLNGNPDEGFGANFMTNSFIGDNVKFQYLGHAGVLLENNSRYNKIRGQYRHIGRPPNNLGADIFVIAGAQYNYIDTVYHDDGDYQILIDDRSTTWNLAAFGSSNNIVTLGPHNLSTPYTICVGIEGYSSNNTIRMGNCSVAAGGIKIGIQVTSSGQWPNATPVPSNNQVFFTQISAAGGNPIATQLYGAAATSNNVFYGGTFGSGSAVLASNNDTVLMSSSGNGWGTSANNTGSLTGRGFSFAMQRSTGVFGFPDITGVAGSTRLILGDATGVGVTGHLDTSETTAPAGAANEDRCYGDSTAHAIKCSYNNGTFFQIPQVIGSGTATLTTAAIGAGNCGTTVTVVAAGVTTTDTITWAFNAAPAGSNAGLVAWPTSGNVNFAYCPNSAETPAAATANWRVVR